eukprot:gene5137-6411_t
MAITHQPLSFMEKAGYSCGDAAANLVFMSMILFQLNFYTDVFGLSASTAAASGSVDWAKAASPSQLALNLPWGKDTSADQRSVTQQGTGKPWLTPQSLAAVPLTRPFSA